MQPPSSVRRWLALAGTCCVFVAVLALAAWDGAAPGAPLLRRDTPNRPPSWPMWGGTVQRNLVNLTERNIAADWDSRPGKEKNIKWSVALGSKAALWGPTISGGRIFIGTNNNRPRDPSIKGDRGVLMCFRESDGKFLWQIVHDKLVSGRVNDWPELGIVSAPAVEGNRLWYVSNSCEVVCATTEGEASGNVGKIVWKLDMVKDLGVFPHNLATCSPLVVGDTLFVTTSNGVDEGHINIPAPDAPGFLALDKKTGKVRWSSKLPGNRILHGQWSNPVYTVARGKPQVIFPAGDGWLYAFNPADGALLWKFDCNPKGSRYRLGPAGTRGFFIATPVVWENKLYIGVGDDPEHKKSVGHLWCIDITKTPRDATTRDLSPWSDPKVEAPSKFDPKDRRNKDSGLVWHYGGAAPPAAVRNYLFGRTLSTCAVDGGLVYAADLDGVLYCLDAHTGKLCWEEDLQNNTWSSPYVVDGKVYLGNDAGEMYIFEHGKNGKRKKLVKMIQMKGKIRTPPVVCNGVLYVTTENPCRLWAIQAK